MEDLEITMKIVCVGNGSVGKTSLITRFAKGVFTNEYKKTLGVDFLERRFFVAGEEVTAFLYDTAGQEEYDAITRNYYRGASAGIIAFSTTDRASFDAVPSWHRKVTEECGTQLPLVLVQNKIDMIGNAVVSAQEVEKLAASLGLRLYRTCVKDGLNVSEIFEYLASEYLGKRKFSGVNQPSQLGSFTEAARPSETTTTTISLGASGRSGGAEAEGKSRGEAPIVKRGIKKKSSLFTSC